MILKAMSSKSASPSSCRKNSKTLPRGFTIGPGSESSGESVFGLYGDLMNVEEYEVASPCPAYIAAMVTIDVVQVDSASTSNLEGSRKELRSSDPELETIPYRFYHNSLDDTGILLSVATIPLFFVGCTVANI